MNKLFFYKDIDGKIKKYYYCTKCEKGPFREDQINREIFSTTEKMSIFYCKKCIDSLGISFKNKIELNTELNEKQDIKEVKDIYFSKEEDKKTFLFLVQLYDGTILYLTGDDINLEEIKQSALNDKLPLEVVYKEQVNIKDLTQRRKFFEFMNKSKKRAFLEEFYSSFL
jgi:hypothetical protein